MRAASLVMTLGIVAVGAGAFLAVATTPAFAPYTERGADRHSPQEVLPGIYRPEPSAPAYIATAPGSNDAGDRGFQVRPDIQQGTIVLELPRWAGETQAWVERGRRAWHDWQGLIDSEWDTPRDRSREERLDYGRGERQDSPYGYRQRPQRDLDDDYGNYQADDQYAGPEYWSDQADREYDAAPQRQVSQRYAEAPQVARQPRRAIDPSSDDAAAVAAERARDAARDVRAAGAL